MVVKAKDARTVEWRVSPFHALYMFPSFDSDAELKGTRRYLFGLIMAGEGLCAIEITEMGCCIVLKILEKKLRVVLFTEKLELQTSERKDDLIYTSSSCI